ncbi:antitoxin Xre/MbcA/ParS toxin-binding domain-containing protein [Vreelandella rituensis]|uniref:DUF2384 domain-containing protein n=1 Tax=Vreelandella rituensis TaxID=2282306 RepID=A0A368U0W7_9GAMM|nr:antitoxin Xre/MbcA/ParS toxin-binding domain-containing protein [Halomonas rituensis]RCV90695.1 DUF2384 domain-containing protein [Halomonas rituensis]
MSLQQMSTGKRKGMAAAAMRTYPGISKAWGLKEHEAAILLGVPDSTYRRWKNDPQSARLDVNHLERVSLILGIYKALHILLPNQQAADTWLQRPNHNPLFADHSPIERLLNGQVSDLYIVRQHLDAARGGGHA